MKNNNNEILEIEVGPNGEFDEKTTKFIIEKVQEAIDEDILYTEEEANRLLFKMIEDNKRCIELGVQDNTI